MEAEYEALFTGTGKSALGLCFASGKRVYIPLEGDWRELCALVKRCNRVRLDPVQVYEVLEDYGFSMKKEECFFGEG